jgi:hypothetical protein
VERLTNQRSILRQAQDRRSTFKWEEGGTDEHRTPYTTRERASSIEPGKSGRTNQRSTFNAQGPVAQITFFFRDLSEFV